MSVRFSRIVLAAIPVVAFAALMWAGPIAQSPDLYDYADKRTLLGIPNFMDVASNLAFLAAGILGLNLCLRRAVPGSRLAWTVFFVGIALVSAGSAQYHLDPRDGTLVWDRLPMTVAFTAAYAALLGEYASARLERIVLLPALVAGAASVLYWSATGDLAPYFAVQATVFVSGLYLPAALDSGFAQKRYVFAAFGLYALAVVAERLDHQIFAFSGNMISGHSLKHLIAALAPYVLYRMLARRVTGPA